MEIRFRNQKAERRQKNSLSVNQNVTLRCLARREEGKGEFVSMFNIKNSK